MSEAGFRTTYNGTHLRMAQSWSQPWEQTHYPTLRQTGTLPTHMDTMENAKQLKALLCIHDEAISKIQHLGRRSLIHIFLKELRTWFHGYRLKGKGKLIGLLWIKWELCGIVCKQKLFKCQHHLISTFFLFFESIKIL